MRLIALCALALTGAGCAQPSEPAPAPVPQTTAPQTIDPTRIDRARHALPEGYEVAAYIGPPAPFAVWGFPGSPVTDPAACAALAVPTVDPGTARGWSASGSGGIVYAVVAGAAGPPPAPEVSADCAQWTAVSGHTTGVVTGVPGPDIASAHTAGMTGTATTVVEGGTETRSRSETFVAYLDGYVCFVAVVTDPGSPDRALEAGFAADLLAETVSTLRG